MIRVAIAVGLMVLGLLCFLAAIGFTALVAPLVTVAVLVAMVAGGNWLRGGGHGSGSGPYGMPPHGEEAAPAPTEAGDDTPPAEQ